MSIYGNLSQLSGLLFVVLSSKIMNLKNRACQIRNCTAISPSVVTETALLRFPTLPTVNWCPLIEGSAAILYMVTFLAIQMTSFTTPTTRTLQKFRFTSILPPLWYDDIHEFSMPHRNLKSKFIFCLLNINFILWNWLSSSS